KLLVLLAESVLNDKSTHTPSDRHKHNVKTPSLHTDTHTDGHTHLHTDTHTHTHTHTELSEQFGWAGCSQALCFADCAHSRHTQTKTRGLRAEKGGTYTPLYTHRHT